MSFNNRTHYIYSDSLDEMVPKNVYYKGKTYEWCDCDMVYYLEGTNEEYMDYDAAMESKLVTW